MPAPILAAYDPSRDDRAPVELALALAELTGAEVTAVLVLALGPGPTPPAATEA